MFIQFFLLLTNTSFKHSAVSSCFIHVSFIFFDVLLVTQLLLDNKKRQKHCGLKSTLPINDELFSNKLLAGKKTVSSQIIYKADLYIHNQR